MLPDSADIVHGNGISFMAFNLSKKPPLDLLWDLRRIYMNDEVTTYREWHDGFIFDRLLIVHKAHGLVADNLTPNIKGIDAFGQSHLSSIMYHNKGMKKELNALAPRYKFVGDMVDHYKPKTIIETGTNTGARALLMIQNALKHGLIF